MTQLSRSVLLLGCGVEGIGTYTYIRSIAPTAAIGIFDEDEIADSEFSDELNRIALDPYVSWLRRVEDVDLSKYDVVVKSPGIPPAHPLVARCKAYPKPITTQIELFLELVGSRTVIGVTGTKGKSTTSTLLASMLNASGRGASLLGNIGKPVLPYGLEGGPERRLVVELSSYQLMSVTRSPHIAILLEVVPEHLDYHGGLDSYVEAKENILRYQSSDDYCIFNADSPISSILGHRSRAKQLPISIKKGVIEGAYVLGDALTICLNGHSDSVVELKDIPCDELPGKFSLYNILAASLAAKVAGASVEGIRSAILDFKALPHRLQTVAVVNGVKFVDNSIATVPEATIAALEALGDQVETLILGGYDRGLSYRGLAEFLLTEGRVKTIVLLPASGKRIEAEIRDIADATRRVPRMVFARSMAEAVDLSFAHTGHGKTCLLSPAAPSFGQFRNYRERGDAFRTAALLKQTL